MAPRSSSSFSGTGSGRDEFSVGKGQVYDIAVIALELRGMGVVSGHRQGEVVAFFEALPEF